MVKLCAVRTALRNVAAGADVGTGGADVGTGRETRDDAGENHRLLLPSVSRAANNRNK
jgi:hypothetical protein